MSRLLRDLAERHFQKASQHVQKGENKEALEELEKATEAAKKAKANDTFLKALNLKIQLMLTLEKLDEAAKVCGYALDINKDLFMKYPNDKFFKSNLEINLKNIGTIGNSFSNIGNVAQEKSAMNYIYRFLKNYLKKTQKM